MPRLRFPGFEGEWIPALLKSILHERKTYAEKMARILTQHFQRKASTARRRGRDSNPLKLDWGGEYYILGGFRKISLSVFIRKF